MICLVAKLCLLMTCPILALKHTSSHVQKRSARLAAMLVSLLGIGAVLLDRIVFEDVTDYHPWLTLFALADVLRSTIPQLRFLGSMISPVALLVLPGYMWLG